MVLQISIMKSLSFLRSHQLILSIIFLFITSCNFNNENIITQLEKVELSLDFVNNDINLSSISSSIELIELNVIGELISDRIKKIEFSDKYIFVLWEVDNNITVFTRNGTYISSIYSQQSPTFSHKIYDFIIDDKLQNILILDEYGTIDIWEFKNSGILKYIRSFKGNYLNAVEFIKIDNSNEFGFVLNQYEYSFAISKSIYRKQNCDFFKKFFVSSQSENNIILRDALISNGNASLYRKFCNDTIYRIDHKKIIPYKVIRYTHSNSSNLFKDSISNNMAMGNAKSIVSLFYEIKNTYYIKYIINNKEYFYIKSTNGKVYNFSKNHLINDIFGSNTINCIGTDLLTKCYVFSTNTQTLKNRIRNNKIKNSASKEFTNSLDNDKDSNPVLILIKF